MSQYFPELYKRSCGNVKVELDLCNYATTADLKEATKFSSKNLAIIKAEVKKMDIDKL